MASIRRSAWTPDGQTIVFWAGGKIHRIDVASKSVSDIPFHVATSRWVEDALHVDKRIGDDSFDVKMTRFAHASPDGRRVVYEALGSLWIKDDRSGRRAASADAARTNARPTRSGRGMAARSPMSPGTTTRAARSSVVGAAGGTGPDRHDRPGLLSRARLLARRQLIAYRKGSDGFLATPLWGQDPGLYVLSLATGKARTVSKSGAFPSSARPATASSFVDQDGDNEVFKSISVDGADRYTHLKATNAAEFALSPDEQFIGWTERYQAYVMPFARTGRRSISRRRPRRCRSRGSAPTPATISIGRATAAPLLDRTAPTFTPGASNAAAFDGAKTGAVPPVCASRLRCRSAPHASGTIALTGARIVTMSGDQVIENGTVVINGNRIAAVGPAGSVAVPAGARDDRRQRQDRSSPGFFDAHWHGPHALGPGSCRDQDWVYHNALAYGVTTIHDPSTDTHEVFAVVRAAEGRQDPRPAHLLDRHHPLRRGDTVHGRDRLDGRRRSPTSGA